MARGVAGEGPPGAERLELPAAQLAVGGAEGLDVALAQHARRDAQRGQVGHEGAGLVAASGRNCSS